MTSTIDLESRERELHAETARLAAKHGIPGVAVGVEHEARRVYAFYGTTSIENPLPVDSRTLFQIGSNTKTFTATAIMRLVERGVVDLHAPVCRYVPDLRLRDPEVAERVTVLHLLNHTAGWSGDFFADTGHGDDALERYVARLPELEQESPLGRRVSYNNAAFSTAGHLIERMTGVVYEQAVRQLVIDPLGLEDTVFPPEPVLPRRYAVGHFVTKDGVEVARRWLLQRSCSAAGTLLSTPADMLRYARFHRGDGTAPDGSRLLSQASLDLMKRPSADCPGNALGDAIGVSWLLREVDGTTMAAHGGGTNGQISAFQTIPERGFAVAILTNASAGGELTGALLEWVLQRWLGIEPTRYEPMPASDIDLLEYAGTYQSQSSVVRLEIKDGKLLATSERTEVGKRWSATFAGEQAEKLLPPPFRIELLDGERIRPQDGPPRPVGSFVREDGDIVGLTFGGRFARRT